MTDREKVIKGLECCCVGEEWPKCEDCPYADAEEGTCILINTLLTDALELLKAQEPGMVNVTITPSDGWKEGNCPFCGMKVDSFYNWSFCGTCGKGLKWE